MTPALSVVIATTQPWPEARAVLDSLHGQVADTDAELVLAHRGDGFPGAAADRYPRVRAFVAPGASASELRGAALGHVTGDVVAITEDHCVVAPDWVEAILRAHREHPEAAAIGGAVENGATDRAMDWAGYFVANAHAMAPLRERDRLPGQANVSYKRWALPEAVPPGGFHELDHNQALAGQGAEVRVDPTIVVWHDQSLGFRGTLAIHFHAARASAGLQAAQMNAAQRLVRALVTPVRHAGAVAVRLAAAWRKGRMRRRMVAVSPAIALVAGSAGAGKFLGFLAGPGDSPRRLR
jgi:hypothetical protein